MPVRFAPARSNAEGFRFGLEEDARVVRSIMPEMSLPAAQIERLIDTVRHLEHLSEIDGLLTLSIAGQDLS
jgi:hypothetical protein